MIFRFTGPQRYNYFINNLKINGKIICFSFKYWTAAYHKNIYILVCIFEKILKVGKVL